MLDARSSLPKLRHELGHVVSQRHRLREPLLLHAQVAQLGLKLGHVGCALRELRGDLLANFAKHLLHHALCQQLVLKEFDQCTFDVFHPLVDGHRADRLAALMMAPACVDLHSLVSAAVDARVGGHDRATAVLAFRQPGQRVACGRPTDRSPRSSRREPLLHCEPDVVIDDPPLRELCDDGFLRVCFHADGRTAVPHLLDPPMNVDAAITRVQQDRADRARRPRATAPAPSQGSRHAFEIELMRDRSESTAVEVFIEDAPNDARLRFVNDSDRVPAAGRVYLPFQLVAVACTTSDPASTHARPQCFTRTRPDVFQLHLMAGTLDECCRLIDRIGEQNLLSSHVVVKATAAITDQVSYNKGYFERITS